MPGPRPFPWRCPDCGTHTVTPVAGTTYAVKCRRGDRLIPVTIAADIPTCSRCGGRVITTAVDDLIQAELDRLTA